MAYALVRCGLMFPSFTGQTGAVIARPVRTSEDGRFEIRSGVAGYRLDLEVDRPGYVRAWKTLSLTRTEQDKDLGEIVLEIEKPVQKLTVELPKLQGLTPKLSTPLCPAALIHWSNRLMPRERSLATTTWSPTTPRKCMPRPCGTWPSQLGRGTWKGRLWCGWSACVACREITVPSTKS